MPTSIQHSTGNRKQSNQARIINRHSNQKGRNKIASVDVMILYMENPENFTKIIRTIWKINKENKSIHNSIKNNKILETDFIKDVKDVTENYTFWWVELKKTQINGKVSHVHGWKELILLKCPYYQVNLEIQCNLFQNSNSIFQWNKI